MFEIIISNKMDFVLGALFVLLFPVYSTSTNEEVIGNVIRNISEIHFSHYQCLIIITEEFSLFPLFLPAEIPRVGIQIHNTNFDNTLVKAMDLGCMGYIIHCCDCKSVFVTLAKSTRIALLRGGKKIIVYPECTEVQDIAQIMHMEELELFPDTVFLQVTKTVLGSSISTQKSILLVETSSTVKDSKGLGTTKPENISDSCSLDSPNVEEESSNIESTINIGNNTLECLSEGVIIRGSSENTSVDYKYTIHNFELEYSDLPVESTFSAYSNDTVPVDSTSTYTEKIGRIISNKIQTNKNVNRIIQTFTDVSFGVLKFITHKFVGENPAEELLLESWSSDQDEFPSVSQLFPDKTQNLLGKSLVVAAVDYTPYSVLGKDINSSDGVEVRLLAEFSKQINFTWEFLAENVNLWGTVHPNGSGHGVIGDVAEGKADIGISAIISTIYLIWNWTDFGTPHMSSATTGVVPAPTILPRWHTLILPFSTEIWVAMGVTFLVSAFGTYCVSRLAHKFLGTMGPYTTLFNTALLVFGMLVMQVYEGAHEENRYVVLRALTALLDMMIFTLSSIYTGGLASVLTIPRYGRPIDTLREMADSNILWAAQDEAFVFSIRGTGDPILDHLNENFRVLDEEELAVRALRGDMGFVMEVLSGGSCCFSSHLTPRAMAKLRIMREPLYWSHIIFIFRKSSPYIEKFNNLVYKMRESGIMYYWEGEVARKFNSGCGPGPQYDAGPTKLQLGHVQGAFFALGFGLMASLLVFCWELLKAGGGKRIKNRRHKGPC
ncbi:Ionotropic receptor 41a8 [Blattella germanica]|nr:Ionotropic receptor 41a8 [Blattella germanica]